MYERSTLYKAAALLSFTGSGIAVFTYAMAGLFYSKCVGFIQSYTNILSTEHTSPGYFLVFAALYAVSLAGIIQLWKGKATGFFFYLAAQLLIMLMPPVVMGANTFSYTNAIFTLLFLAIYALWYRDLRAGKKLF